MSGNLYSVKGSFANWAPRLYEYCKTGLDKILGHYTSLKKNFPLSNWAAATFNLGPKTECFPHEDYGNLVFGWCSITALGRFNPKKGGHIILWNLGLVIEFPPGSSALIPSSIVRHSNVPICENEFRMSFTQFSAGGIFRWVDQGFKKQRSYLSSLKKKCKEKVEEAASARFEMGLGLFSTLAELQSRKRGTE
jgi:hypothetical protein